MVIGVTPQKAGHNPGYNSAALSPNVLICTAQKPTYAQL
jgi:hypothetical protein